MTSMHGSDWELSTGVNIGKDHRGGTETSELGRQAATSLNL